MTIQEILQLPRKQSLQYINVLDSEYFKLTGGHVCRSCPTDITYMLNILKREYLHMTQFELKQDRAIYKVQKGRGATISNDTMSDGLAIDFLSVNPERIGLFSKYPANWQELLPKSKEEELESFKELEEELKKMKLSELKEQYPDIKTEFGQKKSDFIDKVISLNK